MCCAARSGAERRPSMPAALVAANSSEVLPRDARQRRPRRCGSVAARVSTGGTNRPDRDICRCVSFLPHSAISIAVCSHHEKNSSCALASHLIASDVDKLSRDLCVRTVAAHGGAKRRAPRQPRRVPLAELNSSDMNVEVSPTTRNCARIWWHESVENGRLLRLTLGEGQISPPGNYVEGVKNAN